MEKKKADPPTEGPNVDGNVPGASAVNGADDPERPRVVDRRRVQVDGGGESTVEETGEAEGPRKPTYVEELQNKVAVAEEKLREHIEHLDKESADFRARQSRELERRTQEANKKAVSGFLAIADDMGRATAAALESMNDPSKGRETLESLVRGVQMIQGRFFQELASLGVQPFVSKGQPFNPERHEAVRMVEVNDPAQDGIVIDELVPGYQLGEEILRPSQVAVGKHKVG
jgi:molecular chaperone GrpE